MDKTEFERLIEKCALWDGYKFDPLTYISAVNSLYDKDKDDIISALKQYNSLDRRQMAPDSTKIFFLLRLLFVPADSKIMFPNIGFGKPLDENNPPTKDYPLYPLVVVQDVPLLIVSGFFLAGVPENPIKHIEFCNVNCNLRSEPLCPPDNPLSLAEILMSSVRWYRKELEHDKGMLRAQLLRLIRKVYAEPDMDEITFYTRLIPDSSWEKYKIAFDSLNPVWDKKENNYRLKK